MFTTWIVNVPWPKDARGEKDAITIVKVNRMEKRC
jgi:hypothetical protein